jgi:hypothetical protein
MTETPANLALDIIDQEMRLVEILMQSTGFMNALHIIHGDSISRKRYYLDVVGRLSSMKIFVVFFLVLDWHNP